MAPSWWGMATSLSGYEAFRWTSGGGMVGLGDLPGGTFESDAKDVSADGSVIVGHAATALGFEAFVWTGTGGMQNLRELLIAGGATGLTGWTLTEANAVSADGRTVVGYGTNAAGNQGAWAATIPEPSSLTLAALALFAFLVPWARRKPLNSPTRKRGLYLCSTTLRPFDADFH